MNRPNLFAVLAFAGGIVLATWSQAQTPAAVPAAAAASPPPAGAVTAPGAAVKRSAAQDAKVAPSARRGYDRRLAEIRKRGEIVVATSQFVPWAFDDPKVGWLGFDIDVARQLAADLGVTLKIVDVPFPRLLESVRNGDVDIALGVSITPQRALSIAFSQPYSMSNVQLVVRKEDAARHDWNESSTVIGVRAGTVGETALQQHFPLAQSMPFLTDAAMFAALAKGTISALIAPAPQGAIRGAVAPGSVVVAQQSGLAQTAEGFAVQKGQPSLVNFLNAWITYWRADGWLDSRHREWFDSLGWISRLSRP